MPKRYLQNVNIWYNKNRNEKPQTWFASCINKKRIATTITDAFFIGYSLLLKIMQIAIIKAKAMIVTKISEKNNMYKIAISVDSIISLTPFMEANHI